MSNQRNSTIIKHNVFNPANIVFEKLDDNPRISSQKLGFIGYKTENNEKVQLKLQTPEIDAEAYGIPREGPFYPDAFKRSFYKFPFAFDRKKYEGIDYDAIEAFYNKLAEVDKMCDTDEFRKTMFGDDIVNRKTGEKSYQQYTYQPLIRIPEEDEEKLGKDGKPMYLPPYTKIKLPLEFSENKENPSTKPIFSIFEVIDGKRTKVQLETFDDVLNYVTFRSKLRFIIHFSKFYAMKNKPSPNEKKKYGIILKATHIEVKRPVSNRGISVEEDAFLDSDNEEESNQNVPTISRVEHVEKEVVPDVVKNDETEEIKEQPDSLDKQIEEIEDEGKAKKPKGRGGKSSNRS